MPRPSRTRPVRTATRRRLPWGWILIALVLLGSVSAYFGARPAWRKVKAFRAHRFVREAEANYAKENWTSGFERTRSALQLAPTDPDILRHAAYSYARFGFEAAFRYFEALLASPHGTTRDREEYAAFALRANNLPVARDQVDDLMESATPSARTLTLASQLALLRRDHREALRLARDAAAREPGNPTNQFVVATVLAISRRPADVREARDILWPYARTNGPLQILALGAILGIREPTREEREEVERILAARPTRSREEEMLLADARIALDPSSVDRVATALVGKFGHASLPDTLAMAEWLNRRRLFGRTLEIVLADAAAKDPSLFRLRYQALAGRGDLRAAYEFLSMDNPPGEPIATEFLRCETAIRLGDKAAVEGHYKSLLSLAQKDPRALRYLADFASRNGNRAVASEVHRMLLSNPRDAATALRGLIRHADLNGEVWNAREYTRKLAELRPDDERVQLQLTYYDLLLKENLDRAVSTAEILHQAKPEDYGRRAVLALAHLRRGDATKASALLIHEKPDWKRVPVGVRAVTVAALGGAGHIARATNLLPAVPISRLKAEERDLIKPFLLGTALEELPEEPTPGSPLLRAP